MEDLIKEFMTIQLPGSGYGSGSGSGYGSGYGSGSGYGDGSGYGSGYGSGSGSGYGDGSGYGSGDGSGSGSGSGYGDGSGYGSGDGSGDGSGYGSGDGSGDGDGSGYGSGYGSGDGSGDGSGYGSGDGSGYGSGSGDGSGYGSGDGSGDNSRGMDKSTVGEYRKGFLNKEIHSFKSFNGHPVYYIDDIPCIFIRIITDRTLALVDVICDDMTLERMFIAKQGNLFAHGSTSDNARQAVQDKYTSSLSYEEKKAEFISKFKYGQSYKAKMFYDWHHFLTGSCESGRNMFIQSRGISLDQDMTVLEFLNLTKNEYNGAIIQSILSNYE